MATKTTFSPEEWELLMEGVMSSGVAVTAADPSGLWGLMKESFAGAKSMAEAKANPDAHSKTCAMQWRTSRTPKPARASARP